MKGKINVAQQFTAVKKDECAADKKDAYAADKKDACCADKKDARSAVKKNACSAVKTDHPSRQRNKFFDQRCQRNEFCNPRRQRNDFCNPRRQRSETCNQRRQRNESCDRWRQCNEFACHAAPRRHAVRKAAREQWVAGHTPKALRALTGAHVSYVTRQGAFGVSSAYCGRQATWVPWDVGHFAQCQGPWQEHGVHARAAALFIGSGAVSRRQSTPSVRGSGAVTCVGSPGVPRREMLPFLVLPCSKKFCSMGESDLDLAGISKWLCHHCGQACVNISKYVRGGEPIYAFAFFFSCWAQIHGNLGAMAQLWSIVQHRKHNSLQ